MNEQQEREAFERELSKRGYNIFARDGDGSYASLAVHSAWKGWQARAALAANVPAGWKLVPVEPTQEMLNAAFDALEAYPLEGNIRRHYRATLAAAPTPEESSVDADAPERRCGGLGCDGNCCQPAPEATPLKARPDFIAGYDAGLIDGRACERRDRAEATPAQAQQADEPTCFGAGDVVRLRAAALAVFDGPECPQIARDVIEWYHGSLLVEVCDDPSPAPAQAQQAKPLTDEQIVDLLYPIYDGLRSLTPITDMKVARATEAACAKAWDVKLAGIEPKPRGWVCQKCGVDRCKEACPKGHTAALTGDCPMVGIGASTGGKP